MKKLIENQFDENQVSENELEEVFGGSGGCDRCGCRDICKFFSFADEDGEQNVAF